VTRQINKENVMFKVGDEVVLLTITGSGYCKVLEVGEDEIKTDIFSDIPGVEPKWEPVKLYRYANDSDREWLRKFYEALNKTTSNALNELESGKTSKTFNSTDELFEDLEN